MSVTPSRPRRGYSFTGHAVANPAAPPPGDRIDSEVDRINTAIADVIDWVDGTLRQKPSRAGFLAPISPALAAVLADPGPPYAGAFTIAGADPNALAMDWAEVSFEWAEHMPDTIPPNILATMGITGDHWSSRWWANRAAQIIAQGQPGGPFLPLAGGVLSGNLEGERSFFGQGNYSANWLESLRGTGAVSWNGMALLAPLNGPPLPRGIVVGMRTSDPNLADPLAQHVMGFSSYAIADNPTLASVAYGGYFEVWRRAGAAAGSVGLGIEIDIAECNSGISAIVSPFDRWREGKTFGVSNLSCALWLASGANLQAEIGIPVYPASLAIGVLDNGAKFRKGMVFKATALDPTIGAGTNGVAIEMARGQSVRWLGSDGMTDAEIWGDTAGLQVPAPINSRGVAAGLNFTDRTSGTLWTWLADGGNAELFQGGPKLVVDSVGGLTIFGSGLSYNGSGIQVYNGGAGDLAFRAGVTAGPFTYFSMKANGDFQVLNGTGIKPGGGAWVAPSSVELKTDDVTSYDRGLAEIIQLNPVIYGYSGKGGMPTGQRYAGLTAEDVAPVMPEMIVPLTLGGSFEAVETLGVDTGPLVMALVNAVKELAGRLTVVEGRAK